MIFWPNVKKPPPKTSNKPPGSEDMPPCPCGKEDFGAPQSFKGWFTIKFEGFRVRHLQISRVSRTSQGADFISGEAKLLKTSGAVICFRKIRW